MPRFDVNITNQDPKDDPITYNLETIQDIVRALNNDNIDMFLVEFEASMRSIVAFKQTLTPEQQEEVIMTHFVWTDDKKKE